ncbi:MAG: (R)-mandelonitrile lyase [Terracidiphilus sp.]
MNIIGASERTSRKGPEDWFTGTVWIDEIAIGEEPSRVRFVRVSFEPGARTAWHTHPLGQVLYVISGIGLVQVEGGPVRRMHPGETVTVAPHERHWHGAGPANTMVHLALQEADAEGIQVQWLEEVTDAEYRAG